MLGRAEQFPSPPCFSHRFHFPAAWLRSSPVNYVQHTLAAHRWLLAEPTCRPHHISLYMALFHQWNSDRFPKLLKIERTVLMQEARIGTKRLSE